MVVMRKDVVEEDSWGEKDIQEEREVIRRWKDSYEDRYG